MDSNSLQPNRIGVSSPLKPNLRRSGKKICCQNDFIILLNYTQVTIRSLSKEIAKEILVLQHKGLKKYSPDIPGQELSSEDELLIYNQVIKWEPKKLLDSLNVGNEL